MFVVLNSGYHNKQIAKIDSKVFRITRVVSYTACYLGLFWGLDECCCFGATQIAGKQFPHLTFGLLSRRSNHLTYSCLSCWLISNKQQERKFPVICCSLTLSPLPEPSSMKTIA